MSESEPGKREWRFYIGDMLDFARKVLAYTANLDQQGFVSGRAHL